MSRLCCDWHPWWNLLHPCSSQQPPHLRLAFHWTAWCSMESTRDREYQRGDEVAWYPDGNSLLRDEYNPLTAYAYDKVFGPQATTSYIYDVAARPVGKTTMEGVNGTAFSYGVTSSGNTHTNACMVFLFLNLLYLPH